MKTDVKDLVLLVLLVGSFFLMDMCKVAHSFETVTSPQGGGISAPPIILDVTSPQDGGISASPITLDVTQAFQIIHIQKIELDKKEYLLNIHRYRKEAIKKEIELLKLVLFEDSNESKILDRFLEILGE
jgi:Rieske Fe-S protein